MLVSKIEKQKEIHIVGCKTILSDLELKKVAEKEKVSTYEIQEYESFNCTAPGQPNIPTGFRYILSY